MKVQTQDDIKRRIAKLEYYIGCNERYLKKKKGLLTPLKVSKILAQSDGWKRNIEELARLLDDTKTTIGVTNRKYSHREILDWILPRMEKNTLTPFSLMYVTDIQYYKDIKAEIFNYFNNPNNIPRLEIREMNYNRKRYNLWHDKLIADPDITAVFNVERVHEAPADLITKK